MTLVMMDAVEIFATAFVGGFVYMQALVNAQAGPAFVFLSAGTTDVVLNLCQKSNIYSLNFFCYINPLHAGKY